MTHLNKLAVCRFTAASLSSLYGVQIKPTLLALMRKRDYNMQKCPFLTLSCLPLLPDFGPNQANTMLTISSCQPSSHDKMLAFTISLDCRNGTCQHLPFHWIAEMENISILPETVNVSIFRFCNPVKLSHLYKSQAMYHIGTSTICVVSH